MPIDDAPSLFGDEVDDVAPSGTNAPLSDRFRPRTIAEFSGQEHLLGAGRWLRGVLDRGEIPPSIIFWGPPGTGKTTLARIIATRSSAKFVTLSAVLAGVKELREAIASAKRSRRPTIVFIDEIHRFNKAQQDALLPAVEDGTITLIGATTENPSFEVNSALLSRCRVLTLEALSEAEVLGVLKQALADPIRGLGASGAVADDPTLSALATASNGDARVALGALEAAVAATAPDGQGKRTVALATVREALGRARFSFDNKGEEYYNLISALIKSVRNSDANAALYWLARLIEGGADPMYIARRLCILASEDIGLADPGAVVEAAAAAQITHMIGLPEALFPLAQTTIRLARAAKSNMVATAYAKAAADAAATAGEPVPLHLRNAVTNLMKKMKYGEGYRYIHDDPASADEMPCLPRKLIGKDYFTP